MPVQGYDYKITEVRKTCPFNKAHQVPDLQKHLMKCKNFDKNIPFSQCPFNGTHYVQDPEFLHHIQNCEDRHIADRHMMHQVMVRCRERGLVAGGGEERDVSLAQLPSAPVQQNHVAGWDQLDEDWMAEVNDVPRHQRATYNPQRATETRAIYRRPERHMGRSERNKFREQSSELMQQQQSETYMGGSVTSSSVATMGGYSATQLRRPVVPAVRPEQASGGCSDANPILGLGRGRGRGAAVQPTGPAPAATGGARVRGALDSLPLLRDGLPTVGGGRGAAVHAAAVPLGRGRGRGVHPAPSTPGVRLGQASGGTGAVGGFGY